MIANRVRDIRCVLTVALVVISFTCTATDELDRGGRVEALTAAGERVELPQVSTSYDVSIAGDLAVVTLTQQFANPLDRVVNAEYVFPLNKDSAVYKMVMEVGEERIQAKIDRKEEAEEKFEQAKEQGKSAALLKQYRPNVFTQQIANLAPKTPIRLTISYTQTVPRVDYAYELVLPLVVGPRYRSGKHAAPSAKVDDMLQPNERAENGLSAPQRTTSSVDSRSPFSQFELETLPDDPPVISAAAAHDTNHGRVSIDVRLSGAMTIQDVESDSHSIVDEVIDARRRHIRLDSQTTVANRDFRLRYQLAADDVAAGVLAQMDDRGGFFSVLIEAPADSQETEISPREMVFVLDCSGSMHGAPLETSKLFMRRALRRLRPTDRFRIIRFSDRATEFSKQPLLATPENIDRGVRYTNSLNGGGGTEMTEGIRQALATPLDQGVIRIVSFLTDGYIGDEAEILTLIRRHLGSARLIGIGVGSAPNRYLLSEMGYIGRGFARYIDPAADADAVTAALVDRLQSPVLTNITIDWGGLQPREVYPSRIPDLFAGQSVRVTGRYDTPGRRTFTVHGQVRQQNATLPIPVTLPAAVADKGGQNTGHADAIAINWARAAIADRMRRLASANTFERASGDSLATTESTTDSNSSSTVADRLKAEVTDLGLKFDLVTRWTAFVAVSERVYNADGAGTDTLPVPQHQVANVTRTAYPQNQVFIGHAAPEPGQIFGVLVLAIAVWLFGLRSRLQSRRYFSG